MNLSGVAPEECTKVMPARAVRSANSGRVSAAGFGACPARAIGRQSSARGTSARSRVTPLLSFGDARPRREQLAVGLGQRCARLLGPRGVVGGLVVGTLPER